MDYTFGKWAEKEAGAGLKVQTWTESPRFPSYCSNGCRPVGHDDFKDTLNVRRIKVSNDLAWRAENIGKGQVSCMPFICLIPNRSVTVTVCCSLCLSGSAALNAKVPLETSLVKVKCDVQGQQDHSKWAIIIPETSDSRDVKVSAVTITRQCHKTYVCGKQVRPLAGMMRGHDVFAESGRFGGHHWHASCRV